MSGSALPYFVVIGASGGEGLQDIIELLHALPLPTSAIVMAVLHRPSDRVSALRDVLARGCHMPVVVASDADDLSPGTCYIGEPDGHLTLLARNKVHLVPGAGHTLRNRTVDALFKSVALVAGPRVIGVILSGHLDDGSRGLAAIHSVRGITMVLDPGRKPRGMQQNAMDYDGPIDFIGTTQQIAVAIEQVLATGRRPLRRSKGLPKVSPPGRVGRS